MALLAKSPLIPNGPDERESLSALLRDCRTRIASESRSLGAFLRQPSRVGRPVTQEEVAEAVGISRNWYGLLESDRPVRVSPGTAARIADALMMDTVERGALFRLAVPELRAVEPPAHRSTTVLESFGSMLRLSRRLWSAINETEMLTLVREYAMMQLAPDLMVTCTRVGEHRWDHVTTGNNRACGKPFVALIREQPAHATTDDLLCHPFLAQPGDVMTRSELEARFPDLAAKVRRALDAGCSDLSFAIANVRSQRGLVARLVAVHHTPHDYSETEREHLSALAVVTSLALSACVSSSRDR